MINGGAVGKDGPVVILAGKGRVEGVVAKAGKVVVAQLVRVGLRGQKVGQRAHCVGPAVCALSATDRRQGQDAVVEPEADELVRRGDCVVAVLARVVLDTRRGRVGEGGGVSRVAADDLGDELCGDVSRRMA